MCGDDDDEDGDGVEKSAAISSSSSSGYSTSNVVAGNSNGIVTAPFSIQQRVYARDDDGLLYMAVIRRSLYGRSAFRQCKVGYISLEESNELEKMDQERDPSWHYFIHFDGWNVKWDRWVEQENIFDCDNIVVKKYSARLQEEHKALRESMTPGKSHSKKRQSIDSAKFLQAWRLVVDQMDEEFQIPNPLLDRLRGVLRTTVPTLLKEVTLLKKKNIPRLATSSSSNNQQLLRKRVRNVTLEQERILRSTGLTKWTRNAALAQHIVLPQSLLKILVDQWEIITTCHMVATIPAPITVRQALNQYIQSKGVVLILPLENNNGSNTTNNNNIATVNQPSSECSNSQTTQHDDGVEKAPETTATLSTTTNLDSLVATSHEEGPAATLTATTLDESSIKNDDKQNESQEATALHDDEYDKKPASKASKSIEKKMALEDSKPVAAASITNEAHDRATSRVKEEQSVPSLGSREKKPRKGNTDKPVSASLRSRSTPLEQATRSGTKRALPETGRDHVKKLKKKSSTSKNHSSNDTDTNEQKTTPEAPVSSTAASPLESKASDNKSANVAKAKKQASSAMVKKGNKVDGTASSENREESSMSEGGVPITETTTNDGGTEKQHAEWIEMADGMALFFDEAIENLLYREERAQFRVIQSNPQWADVSYSNIYGTEHLLRLFVRLPELLTESDLPMSEVRTILAKVNDLVRFLHKNQSNLFGLRHERPSPEILQAQTLLKE